MGIYLPNSLASLSPEDFGFPEKFKEFRQIQRELAEFALDGPYPTAGLGTRRYMSASIPTGGGKSLGTQFVGRLHNLRTSETIETSHLSKFAVLTATRALEDQYVGDRFPGLVDIRGRGNYQCVDYDAVHPEQRWQCDEGYDHDCRWCQTALCTYNSQYESAKKSDAVLTNYQYWMSTRGRNPGSLNNGFNEIGLLICDEAHRAFGELARFLGTWISHQDLHRWGREEFRTVLQESRGAEWSRMDGVWVDALESVYVRILAAMSEIEAQYKTEAETFKHSKYYRQLSKLSDSIERVVGHGRDGNWIWKQTKAGIAFECIWPARYAERYLWSGVPHVLLISATLRPKLLELLGVKAEDSWFREWGRVFPAENSPVYWVPTGRMGKTATEDEKLLSVRKLDEIWEEWGERGKLKGIVHTNSYQRAEWVQSNSRYGRRMILSKPGEAGDAAKRYRESREPLMLVSPSFSEGWDFPDEDSGWQVINKVPFGDLSDPVVKTRMEMDIGWYNAEAMQKLVQAAGRKTRREDQRCVTMITDDRIKGFRKQAAKFAPKWFQVLDAVGGEIPKAPRAA